MMLLLQESGFAPEHHRFPIYIYFLLSKSMHTADLPLKIARGFREWFIE